MEKDTGLATMYLRSLRGAENARNSDMEMEEKFRLLSLSCADAHQVIGVVAMFAAGADHGLVRLIEELRLKIKEVEARGDEAQIGALKPLIQFLDMLGVFHQTTAEVQSFCQSYEKASEERFLRAQKVDPTNPAAVAEFFKGLAGAGMTVANPLN